VVKEQVDVILGGKKRTDPAVKHEVGLHGPLDGLGDLRAGGLNQIAQLATDRSLPVTQRVDVVIDPFVGLVART
jgi:hypothetical protein